MPSGLSCAVGWLVEVYQMDAVLYKCTVQCACTDLLVNA
jgi:hypothetical protein